MPFLSVNLDISDAIAGLDKLERRIPRAAAIAAVEATALWKSLTPVRTGRLQQSIRVVSLRTSVGSVHLQGIARFYWHFQKDSMRVEAAVTKRIEDVFRRELSRPLT